MTVLVLGGDDDEHAVHVLTALRQRGIDAELFDSGWFPRAMQVAYDPASGRGAWHLPSGRAVSFTDISAIYWRSYNGVAEPPLPDAEQAFIAANDSRSLFESLLINLPCRWVNGWRAFQLHQTKPVQFALVAKLGVLVPSTLLTNEPAALRAFVRRHTSAIFKPVQGGAHARPLTAEQLSEDHLRNLQLAPITVQEMVPGTNIRVFVAGERVLACEVRTAELDYRDDAAADLVPHELSSSVQRICRQIAERLDLLWTGIDFRLTPAGEYVFLEANPSPMFLGFEEFAGLPLTEALVELLTQA